MLDDDTIEFLPILSAGNEGEADSTRAVGFKLVKAVKGGVRVQIETKDATARAGSDYVAAADELLYSGAAGEQHSMPVVIRGDNSYERNETFLVTLFDPEYLHVTEDLYTASAMVILSNDDADPGYRIANNKVAFYDGANEMKLYDGNGNPTGAFDPDGQRIFKPLAEQMYGSAHVFDVQHWDQGIALLRAYVEQHGTVSELMIIDHGRELRQMMGDDTLTALQFNDLWPYLQSGAKIRLMGCRTGLNANYGNTIVATINNSVTVVAPNGWHYYVPIPPYDENPIELQVHSTRNNQVMDPEYTHRMSGAIPFCVHEMLA